MGDGCRMLLDENVFHVNSPMKPDAEKSANLGIGGQAVRAGIESAYAEFVTFRHRRRRWLQIAEHIHRSRD